MNIKEKKVEDKLHVTIIMDEISDKDKKEKLMTSDVMKMMKSKGHKILSVVQPGMVDNYSKDHLAGEFVFQLEEPLVEKPLEKPKKAEQFVESFVETKKEKSKSKVEPEIP